MMVSEAETENHVLDKISSRHPGYNHLAFQLSSFLISYPAPFIYIHDAATPRLTSSVVKSVLEDIKSYNGTRYAHVNAVASFTPRLLFDAVLNALADWRVKWEEGCENWGNGKRWNDNVNAFLQGLVAVSSVETGKGKAKETEHANATRMVIVIERAERLKDTLPELIVPLTRLSELTRTEITTVFVSDVRWEDIKPSLGASPDPFYIDIPPPDKQAILQRLVSSFYTTSSSSQSLVYHPSLASLHEQFVSVVYSTCAPFTQDPNELAYIAAARWPGFVQPVLDEHERNAEDNDELELAPPGEDARMRLIRLFTPSLTAALEALHPRLTNATDWARDNAPKPNLLSARLAPAPAARNAKGDKKDDSGLDVLPRMSKFILVSAFLASTNPSKTDLRMFGRGPDERKRRRKKGGATRKASKSNAVAKISQRLLGPSPFPIDRLLAILGVLLEENDVDTRPPAPEFMIPGEYSEMEINRVQVYGAIMELTSMRLLHRTSPPDRLDGPPMFKCGVSYDVALALAREVEVPLNDLLWDPA
ncbi:hypothetical protein PLICRDRAFT_44784 [Plicaturopsis crispa FD-325 SS-3]|nr:hypothetical protein PLICRDRAFT_44784 [Plicaturopsis crispa FD-325 SS-3]